jgi:hypothetical protein
MKLISQMAESVNANVLYFPQYLPDFYAADTLISQIMSVLRRDKPRSVEAICDSITFAFFLFLPSKLKTILRMFFSILTFIHNSFRYICYHKRV